MRRVLTVSILLLTLILIFGCSNGNAPVSPERESQAINEELVVLVYSDSGMQGMNEDYNEMGFWPPYNNLYAQVIRRGEEPEIEKSDLTLRYFIFGNTTSVGKTNFWSAVHKWGYPILEGTGLTGHTLKGTLAPAPGRVDWVATGIPVTQIKDNQAVDTYPIAAVRVFEGGVEKAHSGNVLAVSSEISCSICHHLSGKTMAGSVLSSHDNWHGTDFKTWTKPVFCGMCHKQQPLVQFGLAGNPGLPTFSAAMHGTHYNRMAAAEGPTDGVVCYACHPGIETRFQRDVHSSNGITCTDCHGTMEGLAAPGRQPWVDLPKCGGCHTNTGFEFEQPGKLYTESQGHGGIYCTSCHGSPHAIAPATTWQDNAQANFIQGYAGTINNCSVCHTQIPGGFFHKVSED